jgi:hypothetical protein
MAQKRRYTHYGVSPEQFIVAWQSSDTAAEVATKLTMPLGIVHARASNYRTAGVRLKPMPRRPDGKMDVEALNRLIEALDRQRAQDE